MDDETYKLIHGFCWRELSPYWDTPKGLAVLDIMAALGGESGELLQMHRWAIGLRDCLDMTPKEKAAAALFEHATHARALALQDAPTPPELIDSVRLAAQDYAGQLLEREGEYFLKGLGDRLQRVGGLAHHFNLPAGFPASNSDALLSERLERVGAKPRQAIAASKVIPPLSATERPPTQSTKQRAPTVQQAIAPYVATVMQANPAFTADTLLRYMRREAGSDGSPFSRHVAMADLFCIEASNTCGLASVRAALTAYKKTKAQGRTSTTSTVEVPSNS